MYTARPCLHSHPAGTSPFTRLTLLHSLGCPAILYEGPSIVQRHPSHWDAIAKQPVYWYSARKTVLGDARVMDPLL